MKTYDVGIVGYGWAATAHIDAINATRQGRVAAVCSSRPLDAAALSARHGGPIRVFRSLDEMLADSDRARRRIHEQHLDDEIAVSLAPQDSPDDAVVVNCEPPLDGIPSEIIEAF